MTDAQHLNDLPYYDNPDVCPRCGAAWQLVTVVQLLDGSTIPAPLDFGLRFCPCVEVRAVRPVEYMQRRLC